MSSKKSIYVIFCLLNSFCSVSRHHCPRKVGWLTEPQSVFEMTLLFLQCGIMLNTQNSNWKKRSFRISRFRILIDKPCCCLVKLSILNKCKCTAGTDQSEHTLFVKVWFQIFTLYLVNVLQMENYTHLFPTVLIPNATLSVPQLSQEVRIGLSHLTTSRTECYRLWILT